jgi:hypothetical protein
MRIFALCSLLGLAAVALASQSPAPGVQALGPQIGQRVPDFSLVDQWGRRQTLGSVLGPQGGLLVFFRSADW